MRQTLNAYQSAYASRSVDDFLKVAPFWTRAQIEAEFSRFRSIQLNIENVAIDLDDTGTRARVRCTISTVSVPVEPDAKPMMDKRAWRFNYRPAPGGSCEPTGDRVRPMRIVTLRVRRSDAEPAWRRGFTENCSETGLTRVHEGRAGSLDRAT